VGVPIEPRYQGPGTVGHSRRRHSRPLRDRWRIPSHGVGRGWKCAHISRECARRRRTPPVIHDPSGEFARLPLPLRQQP